MRVRKNQLWDDKGACPFVGVWGSAPRTASLKSSEQTIPGTKIPRWERDYLGDGSYIPYKDYNTFSLTTVSTHDSETLTLWWKDYPEEAQEFAEAHGMEYTPNLTRDLRYQMLKDSHATGSLFHINLLSEYLELFDDLSWSNPDDERINLPGTILPSNWCYRLRPSMEQLLAHDDLREAVRGALPHTPTKGHAPLSSQS